MNEFSRRTFLKAAAYGVGMAGLGPLVDACSSSGNSSSHGGSSSITYWDYTVASEKVGIEGVNDWLALFPKAYPGHSVHKVYVPADVIVSKVIGAGGSKQGPDAFVQSGDLDQLVPAGVVADLTDDWNSWADRTNFVPAAVGKRNGRVYSVKAYSNLVGLWYNQDILDSLSIAPPTTIDELDAALKKIGKGKYTGLAIAGDADIDADFQARAFYSGYGFDYLKPEVAPLQQTFELFTGWLKAGYIPADIATWSQSTSFPRFLAGGIAFCVNGNWQTGAAKAGAKFRYGVTPMPKGPKGGNVYLGGEEYCVSAFSKNKKLAWDFISSTFMSKQGAHIAADVIGSIPNRTDIGDDPIMHQQVSQAFSQATKAGTEYPDPGLGTNVNAVRQTFGEGWSAMLAGQKTPQKAAEEVVSGLEKLLH